MSEWLRHGVRFFTSLIGAIIVAAIVGYTTGDPIDIYGAVAMFALWEATRP